MKRSVAMSLEKEIINYNDNIEDIKHWVTLKGEIRYEKIISFLHDKNIECTWENVTSYMKYDKRILLNVFKYIIVLEELYKSFVIMKKGKNKTNVWNKTFDNAYSEYLSLGSKAKYDNINLGLMKNEQEAIRKFRNDVVHNKILLNRKYGGRTLEEILKIFIQILPGEYRHGFIKDINNCCKELVETNWHINIME